MVGTTTAAIARNSRDVMCSWWRL